MALFCSNLKRKDQNFLEGKAISYGSKSFLKLAEKNLPLEMKIISESKPKSEFSEFHSSMFEKNHSFMITKLGRKSNEQLNSIARIHGFSDFPSFSEKDPKVSSIILKKS